MTEKQFTQSPLGEIVKGGDHEIQDRLILQQKISRTE